ncbi:unnamed protein product [Knipowitschia caucasica]|uniref:FADD n=1 Tax=Knipowitschia caucasica TaxID=637954 RepID=A0AAV2KN37_KNICA
MDSSLEFNALLLRLSSALSAEQLESLKFLCKDHVGKRDLEKCSTGIKLFQILTERAKLGPDNRELLGRMLSEVRPDLRDQLLGSCRTEDPGEQRDELDAATEVLAENLGNQWRKLGRKLGLSEVKLSSISRAHPVDLEETALELIRQWRALRGDQATVRALVQALRDCELNRTADTLEDTLSPNVQDHQLQSGLDSNSNLFVSHGL